jgi:hypothetical protein
MTMADNRYQALGVNPEGVFVLHSRNVAFLRGERLKPDFPLSDLSLAAMIVLMLLPYTIYGINLLLPNLIAYTGTTANGHVQKYYSVRGSDGAFDTWIDYTYATGNVNYEVNQPIDGIQFFQTYAYQKAIRVKYWLIMPDRATVVDPILNQSMSITPAELQTNILIAAVSSVAFILCILYIYRLVWAHFRFRAAWSTASLVVGQIVEAQGTLHKARSRGRYEVILTYDYQFPITNESMHSTGRAKRNDLRNRALPRLGTTVVIAAYPKPIASANPLRHDPFRDFIL